MSALLQQRLRGAVCFLFFATLALDVAWVILYGAHLDHFPGLNWQTWIGIAGEGILFITYCYSVRAIQQVNKWGRAVPILALVVLMLYLSCRNINTTVSSLPWSYYNCMLKDAISATCAIDRTWTTLVIVASALAFVEVVYTLYKGPLDPRHQEYKPEDNIITVSPAHHPYGIQPNGTIPYGEVRPQYLQQQPQSLYQQPVYQNYTNAYPVMQPAPADPAVPLHHIPPRQSTFKYEDQTQPQYPHFPVQQPYQQQPYPLLTQQQPQQQPQQQYQQPHPYSAGAYTQVGPMVTSVPQPGTTSAFTGRVSGISLASPVMPVAVSSSPISMSPTTPHAGTSSDYGRYSSSSNHPSPAPSVAAAVASPTASSAHSQYPSADNGSVAPPSPQPPRNPQVH